MLDFYQILGKIIEVLSYNGILGSITLGIIASLVVHHIAISCVSILLHRNNTHGGVKLSPMMKVVMEGIVRSSSPIIPKEWVAAHMQHHAQSDKTPHEDQLRGIGDPHSPQPTIGTKLEIFFKEYTDISFSKYMNAVDKLYEQNKIKGKKPGYIERIFPMFLLGIIYVFLFGFLTTVIMAAIQALLGRGTITLVNGIGHSAVEKGIATDDHSVNITIDKKGFFASLWNNYFLNFMCGGEQFHGNHHKKMQSADISLGQRELFDLGYWYIRQLEKLGLASNIKT